MKTIFDETTRTEILHRFKGLPPDRQALWGRLTAPKMLAYTHLRHHLRQFAA